VRSHGALLAFLLCVLLDAAMPFEPAARGGVQLEIEDQGEGVCGRRRQAERPEPAAARVPRAPIVATASPGRVDFTRRPARIADGTRANPPRARTHAPDPASPAEDH
jgi:hypothetical protein